MPQPSSVATLVARDICHERGGRTVLHRCLVAIGPETCLGIVGPNGVGKTTLLQILRAGDRRRSRAKFARTRRPPPSATWRRSTTAPPRSPSANCSYRRTGLAAAEADRPPRRPALGRADHRPTTAMPLPWLATRRWLPATSRPASSHAGTTSGLEPSLARPPSDALGRPAGQGGAGGHHLVPLRRHPARRAHQRPRLRRARPPRDVRRRIAAAAWSSSPTTAPSSTAPSPTVLELDEHRRTGPPRTAAAGPGTRPSGPSAAATPRRRYDATTGPRRELRRPGPNAAPVGHGRGVAKAKRNAHRTTTRPSATSGSTAPRSWPRKARQHRTRLSSGPRGGREALGGMGAAASRSARRTAVRRRRGPP